MNVRRPLALAAPALLLAAAALATPPAPPSALELGHGPTVVIVHDLGGTRLNWMPTVRKLMEGHRVLLADLPGHGDTPLPDPFSLEAAAQSLDLLLAKQDPANTVLVGKGMGGLVALLALQQHPARVRGLVLVDAGARAPFQVTDVQRKQFDQWLDQNYDQFLRAVYAPLGRDSAQGVAIHAIAARTAPATMKAYVRAALLADGARAFKSLKVPVLFVATDGMLKGRDWGTAARELGYDPAALPVHPLANAGYLVQQEQPDSLAAVIADFTARTLGSAAQR